jgi:hypothetical protein
MPRSSAASLGRYTDTIAQKDYDTMLGIRDFVYVAKTLPPKEVLAFERENFSIGRIEDVRVDNTGKIYTRIRYAYWPEELPQGRQSYHGIAEVIWSNHMDIKEIHTISRKVDVVHIDDSVEGVNELYWRQTLDITKFSSKKSGTRPGVLSKLRTYCRCDRPWNPDKRMYIYSCGFAHHEECLMEAAIGKARTQSNGSPIKRLFKGLLGAVTAAGTAAHSALDSDVAPVHHDVNYSATIDLTGEGGVMAQVTENKTGKVVWRGAMDCFDCGSRL